MGDVAEAPGVVGYAEEDVEPDAIRGFDASLYELTGALRNLVEDVTPQLGANLDGQTFNITTTGKVTCTTFGATQLTGAIDGHDQELKKVLLKDAHEIEKAIGNTGPTHVSRVRVVICRKRS